MRCPKCGADVHVRKTVEAADNEIWRERECLTCGHRFHSVEFEAEETESFLRDWKEYTRLRDKKYKL